jgi:hypothetical protein
VGGRVLFLLPFDFLMEQLHCSESVVVMFYIVFLRFSTIWVSLFVWVFSPLAFPRLASWCVKFQQLKNNTKMGFYEMGWDADKWRKTPGVADVPSNFRKEPCTKE